MLKRNWSLTGVSLAAIIFYAVCGLLLLLLPSEALAIANYAIAALLLVMGVVCIIGYFRGSVIIGQFGFLLAVGMVLVTLAVVMFCYPTLLASLLPVIWGVSLLIGGFGKIQFAADLRRFGDRRWWTLLLGALVCWAMDWARTRCCPSRWAFSAWPTPFTLPRPFSFSSASACWPKPCWIW